jgi:hypothetical protein
MFNRRKFVGTIVITKGLGDKCYLVSFREKHKKTYYDMSRIPYNLANWLCLMFNPVSMTYINTIHALTHKELDEIEVKGEVLSKQQVVNGYKFTVDLTKI